MSGQDIRRPDTQRERPGKRTRYHPLVVAYAIESPDVNACASCGSTSCDAQWRCSDCGFQPSTIDGFLAFAPGLATSEDMFVSDFFAGLAEMEGKNFWYQARNALVRWAVQRYFADSRKVHELGCGTGFVLEGLRRVLPEAQLSGSDLLPAGLTIAAERVPSATMYQLDARRLPFRDEFDLIGAFDVLEHIDDDRVVISQIRSALVPGGGVLLAVPQHPSLWSQQDAAVRHRRRYRRSELDRKLIDAGFEILLSTSFVTLLLPAMVASRRLIDRQGTAGTTEALQPPWAMNVLLSWVMTAERLLIQGGARLPMGGSRLVAARRVG